MIIHHPLKLSVWDSEHSVEGAIVVPSTSIYYELQILQLVKLIIWSLPTKVDYWIHVYVHVEYVVAMPRFLYYDLCKSPKLMLSPSKSIGCLSFYPFLLFLIPNFPCTSLFNSYTCFCSVWVRHGSWGDALESWYIAICHFWGTVQVYNQSTNKSSKTAMEHPLIKEKREKIW